jgi:hypothetical protein
LLGLSRSTAAASRDAVRRSYERALGSPPDVGFSHDVLFSRAVLLRDAAECLSQLETRRAYDAAGSSSGGHVLDVSMINLPGALVLLQEAGEAALVISLGRAWLADANSDGLAPDVAAAVALAHCDEAADALAADNSVVLVACRHLEAALQLLRRYKMAPQLQQQIMQTLEVRSDLLGSAFSTRAVMCGPSCLLVLPNATRAGLVRWPPSWCVGQSQLQAHSPVGVPVVRSLTHVPAGLQPTICIGAAAAAT